MNLKNLGVKHGTDKATHTYNEMSYLDIYDRYLNPIKNEVEVVVEFGVLNGSSLRMWEEYFQNATIYGIDINPDCKKYESDRIKIFIGDQNDDAFLNSLNDYFDKVDVVIDDGSHITKHQIKTFESLYHLVSRKGFYIIEDLRNSYEEVLNHHDIRRIWPGMSYNDPHDELKNYRNDFDTWIQSMVKKLDFHDTSSDLLAIHHYPMIVIFEKLK